MRRGWWWKISGRRRVEVALLAARTRGNVPGASGMPRPSANEVTMIPTSESLSPPETSNGRAAEGNCVAVRRGGEQLEADPQTQTQVKPIRPDTTASLLDKGEACGASHDRHDQARSSKVSVGSVAGGWAGYAGTLSWWTVETCAGRRPLRRFRAGVRAGHSSWEAG